MSANSNETPVKQRPPASGGWEAFRIARPDLEPHDDWPRYPIPSELQTFERYDLLPEKLQQILTWSLPDNVGSVTTNLPATTQTGSEQRPSRQSESTETHRGQNVATAVLSSAPPKLTVREADSETRSVHSDHAPSTSSSGYRTSFKQRLPTTGIIGSTLDLITSLKQRVEKEQPAAATVKSQKAKSPLVECTSCFDEFTQSDTAKLSCTHSYCKPCLTTLVTTALQNESSFPPKCCLSEIPLKTALLPLDSKQRETYKEKAAEYSIPPQERWYCPSAKCLKWIPPSKLHRSRSTQKCPHCAYTICSICRGQAHDRSSDCPQDFGLEATISLAESEGWRRCYKCRIMVERTTGCRHMTCKCGAQFCYVCGVKWRTCHCTEVDEANRQEELTRRRRERQTALDIEAAEIARAIAEVEALERREAEEHQQQQEQEDLEAQLAQLEEEHLIEEEARRQEAERLEREYRETLRVSVAETCNDLQTTLENIIHAQKQMVDSRHLQSERHFSKQREEQLIMQQKQNQELQSTMESNINKRSALVSRKHKSDMDVFNAEQDELEDDLFLEIQMHLHGKNDKEARERRLQEKFKKQREEKYSELFTKHKSESDALKANAAMELGVLRRTNDEKLAKIRHRFLRELEVQVSVVAAERAWFDLIAERRQNMLSANNRMMIEAVDAGEEPVGLTEEDAARIGPALPATMLSFNPQGTITTERQDFLIPSPTTVTPESSSTSLAELAGTSERLLSRMPHAMSPADTENLAASESSAAEAGRAWAWLMSDSSDIQAGPSGVPRPQQSLETLSPARNVQQLYSDAPKSRWPTKRPKSPLPLTHTGSVPRKTVPVPECLQIRRPLHMPSMEGLQVAGSQNIPPIPRVPSIYLEDRDVLPQTPGAFPVSPPRPRSPEVRERMRVSAHRERPQSYSSIDSSRSSPSTTISPISNPGELLTPRSSVESHARSPSPSAVVTTVDGEEIQQNRSRRQSRAKWSLSDIRGKGKTSWASEEIKLRMRRNVGDAFSA